jgi:hypothetical protein
MSKGREESTEGTRVQCRRAPGGAPDERGPTGHVRGTASSGSHALVLAARIDRSLFHPPVRAEGDPRDRRASRMRADRVRGIVQATLDREAARSPLARLSSLVASARPDAAQARAAA